MMSRGDEKCIGVQKVFRTEHFLVGFSGSFANILPAYQWLKAYEIDSQSPERMHEDWDTFPNFGDGSSIILVTRDLRIWSGGLCPPICIPASFDATGSGSDFAMGAMAVGASAPEAVRVAARFDVYTGGPVIRVSF
jgi:ATP-dependent protease HslVU (ClpYQ) peptidase subunit